MTRMIRILCLALLTIGLVGPSLPARADDRDERHERHEKCEKRIHQAEDKLRDAVQRHGRKADKRASVAKNLKKRSGVAATTMTWITTTITTNTKPDHELDLLNGLRARMRGPFRLLRFS